MAATVSVLVLADGTFAIASSGNDRNGSGVTEQTAAPVGVVALVSKEITYSARPLEKRGRCLHIADIAGRQHQRIGAADDIGERMDLGRPAAARSTDCLDLAPPFPPKAARCALM